MKKILQGFGKILTGATLVSLGITALGFVLALIGWICWHILKIDVLTTERLTENCCLYEQSFWFYMGNGFLAGVVMLVVAVVIFILGYWVWWIGNKVFE